MRSVIASLALLLTALSAHAHFVWLVPQADNTAILVFSDSLEPDENVPITKVAQTQITVRGADGQVQKHQKTEGPDHYKITVAGKGPAEITAACRYGLITKKGDPYLLQYYAKTTLGGPVPAAATKAGEAPDVPLTFVPVDGKGGEFRVHWRGKPAANVEVTALLPTGSRALKADENGVYRLGVAPASNTSIGVRAKYVEPKGGEVDGKAYKEVRHYSTWTIR